MKNVKSYPICKSTGCGTQACYGMINEKARHCAKHRMEGEKHLGGEYRSKECAVSGCGTRPMYGGDDGESTHCLKHGKPLGMHFLGGK